MASEQRGVGPLPPWTLAVTAMLSVQLGSALSVHVIHQVGAAGTAWLRLSWGALFFLAISRPKLRGLSRRNWGALLGLGMATGLVTLAFLSAIERIPLGTAVAIEFLGPLSVAAWRAHRRAALAWPALALGGVLVLTEPWQGQLDGVGVAFAVLSALGWGSYILFTQAVGDRLEGISGLAVTTPIAALTAATLGIHQAIGHLSPRTLVALAGLALLLPVLPFALEMLALRRMTTTAFGTLMALEPAFGAAIGLLVLGQHPKATQVLGTALVVVAGAGAQRGGQRMMGREPDRDGDAEVGFLP